MSTPEEKVKEKVKALLRRFGVYWHMPVQNGMGAPSLDFICCVPCVITQDMVGQRVGLYVAIETKAKNKSFTPRQEHTASLIQAAGAPSFLVNESCGTKYVEEWLGRVAKLERRPRLAKRSDADGNDLARVQPRSGDLDRRVSRYERRKGLRYARDST